MLAFVSVAGNAIAQERFFTTPTRDGADGARADVQLQQETNRGIAHQISITAFEGDVGNQRSRTCRTLGQATAGGICVSAGPHALVAATRDAPSALSWSNSYETRGTTSTTGGTGNTAVLATYGAIAHPAASYCANLVLGGFSDWYLPAKDELDQLFQARALIGGFSTSGYWSSTEGSNYDAWYQHFSNGNQSNYPSKYTGYRVRCVRRAN